MKSKENEMESVRDRVRERRFPERHRTTEREDSATAESTTEKKVEQWVKLCDKKCSFCGACVPDGITYCPDCGVNLLEKDARCDKCNAPVSFEKDEKCPNCGHQNATHVK